MLNRTTEWLNSNAFRNYPLMENASLVLTNNTNLPLDTFLDLQLCVLDRDTAALSLVSLEVTNTDIVFNFEFTGDAVPLVLTIPITAADPFTLQQTTAGYNVSATFGNGISTIANWAPAVYSLVTPAPIEPALIGFMNKHTVDGIQGTTATSLLLSDGIILLRQGYNCSIVVNELTNVITISAIVGAGKGRPCGSELPLDAAGCNDILLYVNGLTGDNNNILDFKGDKGITVAPDSVDPNTLNIRLNVPMSALECG